MSRSRKPKRRGAATHAGLYDAIHAEPRPFGHTAHKGGWIALMWEGEDGKVVRRRISVTSDRAFQAMTRIEKHKETV